MVLALDEFDKEILVVVHEGRGIDFVGPRLHQLLGDILTRNIFESVIRRAAQSGLRECRQNHETGGKGNKFDTHGASSLLLRGESPAIERAKKGRDERVNVPKCPSQL